MANLIKKYVVPHSITMNFDQTPSKFAPVISRPLDIRGNSHVSIASMSIYKRRASIKFFLNQTLHSSLFTCLGLRHYSRDIQNKVNHLQQ